MTKSGAQLPCIEARENIPPSSGPKNGIRLIYVLLFIFFQSTSGEAKTFHFPTGFRWCVASAAYQVEGGNLTSDWSDWEQTPGHIKNNETALVAVDHWNRIDEDIALMKAMHVTDYRMSVEWAKIEPSQGHYDAAAIAHYKYEIDQLRKANIRPMITLQHFTLPMWIRELKGFEWQGFPDAFANYAEVVYLQIAPENEIWITLNEPMISVANGYVTGSHPPGEHRAIKDVIPVIRGMIIAHARAYHRLHMLALLNHKRMRVGVANHLRFEEPKNALNPLDRAASSLTDKIWNWTFPTAIETGQFQAKALWMVNHFETIKEAAHTQDFIGVNYYSGDVNSFSPTKGLQQAPRQDLPKTDLGWAINPEGFLKVLKATAMHFPGKSIIITENGIADSTDSMRPKYILDHLKAVHEALELGIPIKGYCHWSLTDNFEWQEGYTPRFGLYEIDYKTLERKPRKSAILFGKIAGENGF